MRVLLICLLLCSPIYAGADWTALAPGYWVEVTNSNLSADFGDSGIINAWSGGIFDPVRELYCVHGGGHGDSSDNGVYCLDIDNLNISDPVWTAQSAESSTKTGTCSTGIYDDGTPRADHTYNLQQYIGAPLDMMCRMGIACPSTCCTGSPKVLCNDFDVPGSTRGWVQKNNLHSNDGANKGPTAYNDLTQMAYHQTDDYGAGGCRWFEWDIINDTWYDPMSGNMTGCSDHEPGDVDPSRSLLVEVKTNGDIGITDVGADRGSWTDSSNTPTGGPDWSTDQWPTVEFDPVADRFISWDGDGGAGTRTSTWSYDIDADTWTECVDDAGNSVEPSGDQLEGTYGRWQYIPSKNAYILLNGWTENVYIYRLPTSCGGTPTCTNATYNPVAGTTDLYDMVNGTDTLGCGDEVIVGAGTHTLTSKFNIDSRGTKENPIIIRGASANPRPIVTFSGSAQNTINVRGGVYIELRDLEITGGADGIRIEDSASGRMSHHITIDNVVIHDVQTGISTNSNDVHSITIENSEIYDTGVTSTGEGVYIGCNNETCRSWNMVMRYNYIHDMGGSQGDGIEIKDGSQAIIEDNVIHGCGPGAPCVWVYGSVLGPNSGRYTGPRSVVRRNAIWDANGDEAALEVVRDVIVENNVLVGDDNSVAFRIKTHTSATDITPEELYIRHNVMYSASTTANVMNLANIPASGSNIEFEGNAVYGAKTDPYSITTWGNAALDDNVINPYIAADWAAGTYILGNADTTDFISPSTRDFYPKTGSALINACIDFSILDKTYPAPNVGNVGDDYNLTLRSPSNDCGAYTVTTSVNPVGAIAATFKGAEATVVPSFDGVTITGGSVGP